jgi:hypothetical protein
MSIPSRFLLEIPPDLMVGPLDPDMVFGDRRSRFGGAIRSGGAAYRQGSGRPGAPPPGEAFRPTRDLGAKRDAYAAGAPSGSLGRAGSGRVEAWDDVDVMPPGDGPDAPGLRIGGGIRSGERARGAFVPRPVIPGERQFRDGDRVRHARWGDGIVVTSKLTRSDEEITVVFRDPGIGRKTMLASLANLEITG